MVDFRKINIVSSAVAIIVFTGLLIPLWAALDLWLMHESSIIQRNAVSEARNLSIAFEAHVNSVVQIADALLQDVREDVTSHPEEIDRIVKEELAVYGEMIVQLAVINEQGRLVYTSLGPISDPVDLSDREHFKIHKNNFAADILNVSRPVLGKVSGIWSIQITRPIFEKDRFSGVVVLSIPIKYFSDFFQKIDVGQHGSISIVGLDRSPRVVASKSSKDFSDYKDIEVVNSPIFDSQNLSEGHYVGQGIFDSEVAITAYRRLNSSRLVVLVALSEKDVLAPYVQLRKQLFTFAVVCTLVLFIFSLGLFWAVKSNLVNTALLKKTNRLLQSRVRIDSLTGVRSRQDFLDQFQKEFDKAVKFNTSLCFFVFDIDHFKNVNDSYGHLRGDIVLKTMADVCKKNLRKDDVIGRLGGEEFGVLLPGINKAQAYDIAEKLRIAVAGTPIYTSVGSIQVTVSVGLASYNSTISDVSQLIDEADAALYVAKRAGRNNLKCAVE